MFGLQTERFKRTTGVSRTTVMHVRFLVGTEPSYREFISGVILVMNEEIEQLNKWLEERALAWEETVRLNSYLSGSNWPTYFRGLKNLNQQSGFMISSYHFNDPISQYLEKHKSEYSFSGGSGYCCVFKI